FLNEAIDSLGIGGRVSVVRGRAEEIGRGAMFHVKPSDVVTARAVAPLDRLGAWCLPLAAVGGSLLALKGASAVGGMGAHREAVARVGGGVPTIHECGAALLPEPTTVVSITRERAVEPERSRRRGRA